ncbi:class I SAM-dependent methyltransferase [Helicobacter sp. 16-1353]|uniref:class I SAM-dependent methyltransferase n=1 Tax=Helicobacter sp. 16-1353 TaxID=2004996 RepID=UPI00215D096D|nr:class I SAM-dependent methyltransferase [Helicobacter sp. 16-1353]
MDSTESNSAKPSDESKKDFNLYGIDINQNAIECVKKLGIEVETINNIFDFKPSKKFDLIIATHVIEHLPKEQVIPTLRYFRESALSKNGRIFIAVPNASSNTGAYWAYEDWTHNCLFTAGSLIYVLKMAGFKNVEIVDSEAIMGSRGIKKLIRKFFLKIYRSKIAFWNRMTNSAFHAPSPLVFSYEVKALASN